MVLRKDKLSEKLRQREERSRSLGYPNEAANMAILAKQAERLEAVYEAAKEYLHVESKSCTDYSCAALHDALKVVEEGK